MVKAGEMLEDMPSVTGADTVLARHGVSVEAQLNEGPATKEVSTAKLGEQKTKQFTTSWQGPTVHGSTKATLQKTEKLHTTHATTVMLRGLGGTTPTTCRRVYCERFGRGSGRNGWGQNKIVVG